MAIFGNEENALAPEVDMLALRVPCKISSAPLSVNRSPTAGTRSKTMTKVYDRLVIIEADSTFPEIRPKN